MLAPIVMTHGAFCGGWAFEDFRKPFEAAGHTVLAPDLRGHGLGDRADAVVGVSMTDYARDIAELCAAQSQPAILMGHSLGGLVAALAARKTRVRAVVLLAPSAPGAWPLRRWKRRSPRSACTCSAPSGRRAWPLTPA